MAAGNNWFDVYIHSQLANERFFSFPLASRAAVTLANGTVRWDFFFIIIFYSSIKDQKSFPWEKYLIFLTSSFGSLPDKIAGKLILE